MSAIRDKYFDSGLIKKALLESIQVLGENGQSLILKDLQKKGLDLDHDLTLFSLASSMRSTFGSGITDTIIQRIMRRLDEYCGVPIQTSNPRKRNWPHWR